MDRDTEFLHEDAFHKARRAISKTKVGVGSQHATSHVTFVADRKGRSSGWPSRICWVLQALPAKMASTVLGQCAQERPIRTVVAETALLGLFARLCQTHSRGGTLRRGPCRGLRGGGAIGGQPGCASVLGRLLVNAWRRLWVTSTMGARLGLDVT